jgi:NTE family protein
MNKPKIGLALSGGFVLGIAHLGVLKVLEEEGVPIHCVAGTSAGSLVGAFVAAGYSYAGLRELSSALSWASISGPAVPTKGLLGSQNLERFLGKHLGACNIEDLSLPYAAVAVDLTRGQEITITRGPLARAIRASCAVPGIFTPVEDKEALYVDGGLKRQLPVQAARDLGADFVIGVNLIPSMLKQRRPRNMLEILVASFELMVAHIAELEPKGDINILPDLKGLNSFQMSQAEELVRRGEAAARECIPALRTALSERLLIL